MEKPVTVVTGVSRGIGLAIAGDMTRRGHHVVGLARTKPDDFAGTFVAADLADAGVVQDVMADLARTYRVLRLVNNAGTVRVTDLETSTLADFESMMALNVRTVMQCMQAVLPGMRAARFGRIVNIGSRSGLGRAGRGIYGASKAAVLTMTRVAAMEYARDGVTVNCVAPGPIETELFAEHNPPGSAMRADFVSRIPVGRMGTPEEVAQACAYFLSDEAAFTTGQVLYVCGGLSVGQVPA